MQIDHIFCFTEAPTAAAEELLAFGLAEGSSRVHAGQGTTNRKFYFENFFLEILWVHDEAELASPALLPTALGQRAHYLATGAAPYGLCLVNTPDTDAVFANALAYQPAYFPAGLPIAVLPHGHNPSLPWTFRLPFKGDKAVPTEPIQHRAGLRQLTSATFGLAHFEAADPFLTQLAGQPQLHFVPASKNTLLLTFDQHRQGRAKQIDSLGLTLHY